MKKFLKRIIIVFLTVYIVVCVLLFLFQEKLIFFPQRLPANYHFSFKQPFEEKNITAADGTLLSGLLFKADSSKGLIFYLHGNAGSLGSWGELAQTYTRLHYDVFMLDYRGYGKSKGSISSQAKFFSDVQTAYDTMKKQYQENRIIVLGYSIGTGSAAYIASTNNPSLLILQAPYYSLTDMMQRRYFFIPTFILKYKFETNRYLKKCEAPVVIFHGDKDQVIYYGSSLKLQKEFKNKDKLFTLPGQTHNGITDNPGYLEEIERLLGSYR